MSKGSALLLSLAAFLFWWGFYSSTVINFRGVSINREANEPINLKNDFIIVSTFCKDIPFCNRPLLGWIAVTTHALVVKPLFYLFDRDHMNSNLPMSLTTSSMLAIFYIFAFYFLLTRFPPLYGIVAFYAFVSVPLHNPSVGLAMFDPAILFFWGLMIRFLIQSPDEKSETWIEKKLPYHRDTQALIFTGLIAMSATWMMDNTGVAFSSMLFILALTNRFHRDPKPYWKMYFVSTIVTLTTMGITMLATHRHPDYFWNAPGLKLKDMWYLAGRYYSYPALWANLIDMSQFQFTLAALLLVLTLVLGPKVFRLDLARAKNMVWVSMAGMVGFLVTAAIGRYTVGMYFEWTRQLMPFAYLFTFFIFSVCMALSHILIFGKNELQLKP